MTVKDAAEFMAQGRKKGKAVWIGLAAAVLLLIPSPAWGWIKPEPTKRKGRKLFTKR
jgi:hypothetical protein